MSQKENMNSRRNTALLRNPYWSSSKAWLVLPLRVARSAYVPPRVSSDITKPIATEVFYFTRLVHFSLQKGSANRNQGYV